MANIYEDGHDAVESEANVFTNANEISERAHAVFNGVSFMFYVVLDESNAQRFVIETFESDEIHAFDNDSHETKSEHRVGCDVFDTLSDALKFWRNVLDQQIDNETLQDCADAA